MVPDGWRLEELSKITKEKISYGIVQAGPHIDDGIPYIKSGDVRGDIEPSSLQRTSQEIHHKYRRSSVHPGDIVFSLRGNIGEASIVPPILKEANLTQGTARISVNSDNSNLYVYYQLSSRPIVNRIHAVSKGSTFKEISLADLRKLCISVAPLGEQVRIADVLSTWDQAIETTEKLIECSEAQRKALLQQLLTGKKRYPSLVATNKTRETRYGDLPRDWSFVTIGDIATEQTERAGENAHLPVLSCSKYDGFVDSLRYFNKKVYSDDTSNYKVVRRGCYGFPSNHIEEGSIGHQDICEAGIVSPIYSVFKTSDDMHDGYLYRLLKTEHYRQIFQASTNASVDRRGSLRWKEFSKIRVPLPSLAEQQKISETIDAADAELASLKDQLFRLKTEKRALMQQLLTGKRRIKVAA